MRRVLMTVAGVAAVHAHAFADEMRPAAKLSKMFPYLEDYLALPESERTHFELDFHVKPTDPAITEFGLWLNTGDEPFAVPVAEDGVIDIAALEPYVAEDPMVLTDLPKGGGQSNLESTPRLDLANEIAVSDLKTAIDQANRAIAAQAGALSFAAPKFRKVAFVLEPGTTASLKFPSGATKPLDVNGTQIVIRPNRGNRVATLVFSSPPLDDAFKD
ncbi:MAG: hypothetical protein RLN72_10150 [Henriciella sp.]